MNGSRGKAEALRSSFEKDPVAFVQMEKERVENFQYLYTISKVVATVCFIATMLIFYLTKSPVWQGWGIGIALFGLAGLVVDYFSQHRSFDYYDALTKMLAT